MESIFYKKLLSLGFLISACTLFATDTQPTLTGKNNPHHSRPEAHQEQPRKRTKAEKYSYRMAKKLLKQYTKRGDNGQNALDQAAQNGNVTLFNFLKNRFGKETLEIFLELKNPKNHNTPLGEAAFYGHENVITCVVEILGRDKLYDLLQLQDTNGFTPLHHAIQEGRLNILNCVEQLLSPAQFYALLQMKDLEGKTIFYHALECGWEEIVEFLFTYIHDTQPEGELYKWLSETDSDKFTALYTAALRGYVNIFEVVIKQYRLKKLSKEEMCQLLMGQGFIDSTPLDWAIDEGHTEIVNLLKNFINEINDSCNPIANQRPHNEDQDPDDDRSSANSEEDSSGNETANCGGSGTSNTDNKTETTGTQGTQNGNQQTQAAIDAAMASWIKEIQAQHAQIEHAERNLFNLLHAGQELPHVTLKALIEAVKAFEAMGDQELLDFHTNAYNGRNFFNTHVTALENGTEETALMIVMHNRGLFQGATQNVVGLRNTVVANFNAIAPELLSEMTYFNLTEFHRINHFELINPKAEAQANPFGSQFLGSIGCIVN